MTAKFSKSPDRISRRRSLTWPTTVAARIAVLWLMVLLPPRAVGQAETRPEASLAAIRDGPDEVLKQALLRLSRYTTVVAKIRQRVQLYDRQLVGSGSYRQLMAGSDMLSRLELKLPVGDTLSSMLQVSDGRFLWTYRVLPGEQVEEGIRASLSRVDLQRVREVLDEPGSRETHASGGVTGILAMAMRTHNFTTVEPGMLHGIPVLMIYGDLKDEMANVLGSDVEGSNNERLPCAHLPDAMTIVVGADDLFPYRIEYRQCSDNPAKPNSILVTRSETRPIMTLELFEVELNVGMDPQLFVFRPRNFPVQDATDEFLRNERLLPHSEIIKR